MKYPNVLLISIELLEAESNFKEDETVRDAKLHYRACLKAGKNNNNS